MSFCSTTRRFGILSRHYLLLSGWLDDQVSALLDAGVCKKVEKQKKTNMQKVQVRHFVMRPTICSPVFMREYEVLLTKFPFPSSCHSEMYSSFRETYWIFTKGDIELRAQREVDIFVTVKIRRRNS